MALLFNYCLFLSTTQIQLVNLPGLKRTTHDINQEPDLVVRFSHFPFDHQAAHERFFFKPPKVVKLKVRTWGGIETHGEKK